MRAAIFSRPGDCFPNIISQGLRNMLDQLNIESKIFYSGIPFLMRLLPFTEKPMHWYNNFHYRVFNKIKYWKDDKQLLRELLPYDLIIIAECLPNAFWKNYLGIETLKHKLGGIPVLSYTDAYLENAPAHKKRWLTKDDYGVSRYALNLCPSTTTEIKTPENNGWKAIGINIAFSGLRPAAKKQFIAVVDFAQQGFENYRLTQLKVLQELNIRTIVLEGRYTNEEIRKIYGEAAIFFLAFPETFGLPIAECLACGTYVLTPNSAWPMSWRLDDSPVSWGPGTLPDCFKVYDTERQLKLELQTLQEQYQLKTTPFKVFDTFLRHYPSFYFGNKDALKEVLDRFSVS